MKAKVAIRHAKLLILVLPCVGWACAALSASDRLKPETSAYTVAQPSAHASTSGAELIEGYKQWTRVNPVPAIFHSRIALQCAAPTTAATEMEKANPHRDKFITVYVNEIGRPAMMQEKAPRFPEGSVIVKEKLTSPESASPELLTVMIKREAGYSPENGDWEYMAVDGAGIEVQARGHLESCQACHMLVKDTDYVSRNYLPYEVREKLR